MNSKKDEQEKKVKIKKRKRKQRQTQLFASNFVADVPPL